ncbi:calcium:proton antiporter [Scleromatobacter humisilvae]|uniref:Calcium:proton antiporter n=1 Tax=Scleromatobacter humisilvae TaxID=2897159 RepID=A0A9X2BZ47_9BURK|nr:calcium:proton antiporter [Scleromatobacter humisilvae]MCK9686283.1 calcium:proton antiporter [Scleromatobacter humisilvae]
MLTFLRHEWSLLVAALALIVSLPLEHAIVAAGQAPSLAASVLLIAAILVASVRVAHHAETLAERLGEPYGTMVLTLSAVLVEVVILAILMSQSPSPTLARDTIYSAVQLDINALLGLSALLGGLRHGEQPYNIDSGNTYVVMILTGLGVSMVLPAFVPAAHWQSYSVFTIVVMVVLYGLFLRLQTGRHSYFFSYTYAQKPQGAERLAEHEAQHDDQHPTGSLALPLLGIAVGIALIGMLSEVMAATLEVGLAGTGAPPIVAPLVVATISASPEILTALRAALANRMQPVVNIALGASLATVVLTVPVIEALALFTHHPIAMALSVPQMVMTLLTLLVATINIHDGETNAIEGLTHFVLFAAFLMLSAMGL